MDFLFMTINSIYIEELRLVWMFLAKSNSDGRAFVG
jgi:hypothetical protein